MVGLIPLFARRDARARGGRQAARLQAAHAVVPRQPPRPRRPASSQVQTPGRQDPPPALHRHADQLARVLRRMLDEDEFLSPVRHPLAVAAYHREHPYIAATSTARSPSASTTSRRSRSTGPLRRQLQLARADLVPGQLPADRVAAAVPPLLRRRPSRSSARPARAIRMTLWRGRGGALAAAVAHLPPRRGRPAPGVRPARTKLHGDPHWRDLVLFHEYFHGDTGRRPRRQPPDRLDRPRRQAPPAERRVRPRATRR